MNNLLSATEERVYFKDLMSRFLLVSKGWIAAYAPGRAEEELIGKTDFDVFDEQHACVAFADEQQIICTGRAVAGKVGINDCFGHDAGDLVLAEVGRRLSALARRTDTVARLGGDEFVILCGELGDDTDVHLIGDRIIQAAREFRDPEIIVVDPACVVYGVDRIHRESPIDLATGIGGTGVPHGTARAPPTCPVSYGRALAALFSLIAKTLTPFSGVKPFTISVSGQFQAARHPSMTGWTCRTTRVSTGFVQHKASSGQDHRGRAVAWQDWSHRASTSGEVAS